MKKIIIGIHGLGNKPPEKLLRKWWKRALLEGLKARGKYRPFLKFEFVYWSDILHDMPLDPKQKNKNHPLYLPEPYEKAEYFRREQPSSIRKKILDYIEKQLSKVFLNDDLTINFSFISDMIIHRYFGDLDIYYSKTFIPKGRPACLAKDVIRERLVNVLKKYRRKEILLIAHSMGSIIAFDVLTEHLDDIQIDTLATIGSPLGIPVIRGRIAAEIKSNSGKQESLITPENVRCQWYNFSDIKDKIAFNYALQDDYGPNSAGIQVVDKLVFNNYEMNGERNPHKSYGYLRAPEFSELVEKFLSRDEGNLKAWINKILDKLFV